MEKKSDKNERPLGGLRSPAADHQPRDSSGGLRQVGLLTGIPMVMVAGLLVGYFFGSWVDKFFHISPWGQVIFSILGIVAGFKQVFSLIEQANKENENNK